MSVEEMAVCVVVIDAYTELFDFSLRLTSDELVKRQEV